MVAVGQGLVRVSQKVSTSDWNVPCFPVTSIEYEFALVVTEVSTVSVIEPLVANVINPGRAVPPVIYAVQTKAPHKLAV